MPMIEELMQPSSPAEPCGTDLSYDPAMQELEKLLLGKPETQFSAAEDPNWALLRRHSVEILHRSKNLRVAVVLCLALLQTEGLPGFRDGLALLRGWLEQYWDALFPRLDPDDNNDPTERVNILAPLVTPAGAFDDPMQFQRRIREAPLTNSPRLGQLSFAQITGTEGASGETSTTPLAASQVQGAFQDTPPEQLTAIASAIVETAALAREMDELLTTKVGSGRAPDWTPLLSTMEELRKAIAPYTATGEPITGQSGDGASAAAASAGGNGLGPIQSRQDVLRVLDALCEYYQRTEPSSPVPLILRRAQRLAGMNFLEIITNLSPETLAPIHHITSGPDAAPGAPPSN
jgi:type VI secretion system protein ImpA